MVWGDWIAEWVRRDEPEHLHRGRLGERAAKRQLKKGGLKFLYANFASENGEIDLTDCVYGVPLKDLTIEKYETYDFNQ